MSTRLSRRQWLASGVAASSLLSFGVLAQGRAPLKIGLVTSLSGPFTALGESMRAGLQMLIAEAGGQMGGRRVELVVEDDQGKPEEGVRKVRKLLSQDKVDAVSYTHLTLPTKA